MHNTFPGHHGCGSCRHGCICAEELHVRFCITKIEIYFNSAVLSSTMKILTVIGARPQFVKAAVLSRLFRNEADIQEVIVHTGQHFDTQMSDVFFQEMDIPKPQYNLEINGLGHGAMTGQMMVALEPVMQQEKPDFVLVYGDTNSTLAGALTAHKLQIPVVHVEAGLRSFNLQMPEEINRILTDRMSAVLFVPTDQAMENLHKEGFENFNTRLIKSGDVMQDAAMYYAPKSRKPEVPGLNASEPFVLCTIHRAENTEDPVVLRELFSALDEIHQETKVVLPLHPRTRAKLADFGIETSIILIDPVGYFEMIGLLQSCSLVMTDSGGLQKEAFFFGKCCLTLREQTEWVELVENKVNQIVGSDKIAILKAFRTIKDQQADFGLNLYGQGSAGQDMLIQLRDIFG